MEIRRFWCSQCTKKSELGGEEIANVYDRLRYTHDDAPAWFRIRKTLRGVPTAPDGCSEVRRGSSRDSKSSSMNESWLHFSAALELRCEHGSEFKSELKLRLEG